jgi:hypothetical protein
MMGEWPWVALVLMGAYHGLNPAMGWLFALSLGLQDKRGTAVVRALLPIGMGHAVAIGATLGLLVAFQFLLPLAILKWIVAAILFGLGTYRLFRSSHPRGAGMVVGDKDLFAWSFLMASAHGAGLMIVPILFSYPGWGMHHSMAMASTGSMASHSAGAVPLSVLLGAVAVHTIAMLVIAAALALAFFFAYERTGLTLLRRAWFNFDLLWAIALVIAGFAVLLL